MAWGYHGVCCFLFFLFLFAIGFLIIRTFRARNFASGRCNESDEAIAILRKRLASGEIDDAEYQRLKDVLKH